jgi:hypothetical protein
VRIREYFLKHIAANVALDLIGLAVRLSWVIDFTIGQASLYSNEARAHHITPGPQTFATIGRAYTTRGESLMEGMPHCASAYREAHTTMSRHEHIDNGMPKFGDSEMHHVVASLSEVGAGRALCACAHMVQYANMMIMLMMIMTS